ncbi:MAG: DUF4129 domain-containing protein [Cyanobacteria bacterium J06623_7]
MSSGSFKQDSLGWRITLIRQRGREWIEYKLSQLDFTPDPDADFWALELIWQIIKFCLWVVIAVLLVWLTWQLWLLLRPYWRRWQRTRSKQVINAPLITSQSATDWVGQSQAARADGNYRQAIFCLYQAMLKLLDERGIVAYKRTWTDEEYRRSLLETQLAAYPYELLLSMHQRLCFSSATADRTLFEECQQAYRQIETSPQE